MPKVRSGSLDLVRGISTGRQEFETHPDKWPLNQPVTKIEARAQCSGILFYFLIPLANLYSFIEIFLKRKFVFVGEAQYIDDLPQQADELHGALVQSAYANCTIDTIDPSDALVINFDFYVMIIIIYLSFL